MTRTAVYLIDDVVGLVLAAVIPSIWNTDGAHKPLAEAIACPVGVSIGFFLLVEIGPLRRGLVASVMGLHSPCHSSTNPAPERDFSDPQLGSKPPPPCSANPIS